MAKLQLNFAQRIVLVVALGGGLLAFGRWATTRGTNVGWVAYSPLSNNITPPGGLHPWVRLVVWLALTVFWAVTSIYLLRTRSQKE